MRRLVTGLYLLEMPDRETLLRAPGAICKQERVTRPDHGWEGREDLHEDQRHAKRDYSLFFLVRLESLCGSATAFASMTWSVPREIVRRWHPCAGVKNPSRTSYDYGKGRTCVDTNDAQSVPPKLRNLAWRPRAAG
jgi:hypothetical protein